MCNGLTKRSRLGALGVQVNPLVISGGISEELYLLLSNREVLAVSKMLANMSHEVCLIFNDGCHVFSVAEKPPMLRTQVFELVEPHLLVSATLGV